MENLTAQEDLDAARAEVERLRGEVAKAIKRAEEAEAGWEQMEAANDEAEARGREAGREEMAARVRYVVENPRAGEVRDLAKHIAAVKAIVGRAPAPKGPEPMSEVAVASEAAARSRNAGNATSVASAPAAPLPEPVDVDALVAQRVVRTPAGSRRVLEATPAAPHGAGPERWAALVAALDEHGVTVQEPSDVLAVLHRLTGVLTSTGKHGEAMAAWEGRAPSAPQGGPDAWEAVRLAKGFLDDGDSKAARYQLGIALAASPPHGEPAPIRRGSTCSGLTADEPNHVDTYRDAGPGRAAKTARTARTLGHATLNGCDEPGEERCTTTHHVGPVVDGECKSCLNGYRYQPSPAAVIEHTLQNTEPGEGGTDAT